MAEKVVFPYKGIHRLREPDTAFVVEIVENEKSNPVLSMISKAHIRCGIKSMYYLWYQSDILPMVSNACIIYGVKRHVLPVVSKVSIFCIIKDLYYPQATITCSIKSLYSAGYQRIVLSVVSKPMVSTTSDIYYLWYQRCNICSDKSIELSPVVSKVCIIYDIKGLYYL